MTQSCITDEISGRGLPGSFVASGPGDDLRPDEVAEGVFFLKGGTHYFQDGVSSGPSGSVRSLMCNNGPNQSTT